MLQNSSRNTSLDILKGIGIVSMVMGHANMGNIFEVYIAGFHMQLFFIVSGFLYKPDRYPKTIDYVKRKVSTIIVPYIFFAAITIIVCQLANVISGKTIYTIKQFVYGVIWGNQAIFPITGAIWFLQSIFWIEIGYYFIEKVKKVMWSSVIVGVLLAVSILFSVYNMHLPFSMDSALSGIVFYHIGFLIAKFDLVKKWRAISEPKIWLWFTLFVINFALIYLNNTVNPRTCEYSIIPLYYVNAVVGTWIWYIVAVHLEKQRSRLLVIIKNSLKYIGMNSIVFLGINQMIIRGIYLAFAYVISIESGVIKAGRNIIICVFTLVICSIIVYMFDDSQLCFLIGKGKNNKLKQ